MSRWIQGVLIVSLLILFGCGPATMNKMEKNDGTKMNAEEIFNLVSGNSLILTAYDFSGTVYFAENGTMAGIDNYNQKDTGSWDITDQDQLCLKFRLWYYGDIKCYSVSKRDESERLSFFTTNGAAYYTAMMVMDDPSGLAKQIASVSGPKSVRNKYAKQNTSDRQSSSPSESEVETSSAAPKPYQNVSPGPDDSTQTVQRLAANCPGCNFAGVNLKEAALIKANLQEADLSGADLRYANLRRANLSKANLSGARLNYANLPGADLTNANLKNADLTGANLLLTNLTGADLTGAILKNANLEKTIGIENQP